MKRISLLLILAVAACIPGPNPIKDGPTSSGPQDNSVPRVLTFTQTAPEDLTLFDATLTFRAKNAAGAEVNVVTNPAVPNERMTYIADVRCAEVDQSTGATCLLGDLGPGASTSVSVHVASGVRLVCSSSTLEPGSLTSYRPLLCLR